MTDKTPVTYKFDIVAVATINLTTTAGPDAAREAVDSLQAIDNGWDGYLPADAGYQLTCVAPRGRAYLVDTDPELTRPDAPDTSIADYPLPEPIDGEHRDALKAALDEADEALGGDSNDAEHDALYSVRETIAAILGVTYDAPSPDYD